MPENRPRKSSVVATLSSNLAEHRERVTLISLVSKLMLCIRVIMVRKRGKVKIMVVRTPVLPDEVLLLMISSTAVHRCIIRYCCRHHSPLDSWLHLCPIPISSRVPTLMFHVVALLCLYHMRSFWMIGSIFAATTAWVLLGDGFDGSRIVPGGTWRHYAMVAALPAAMALILTICFVPESPRFLANAGRSICKVNSIGG